MRKINVSKACRFAMTKLVVGLIGSLLVATIFFAIKASSQGANLVVLEEQSSELARANQELKDELVSATSLLKISENAQKQGFVTPQKFVYISSSGIASR